MRRTFGLSSMNSRASRLASQFLRVLTCISATHRAGSLRHACHSHPSVTFYPETRITNLLGYPDRIAIEANSHVRGELIVYPPEGRITVGDWTFIGDHSRIWSAVGITIGNRVAISYNVSIHDFNAHPLDPKRRHEHMKTTLLAGYPRRSPDVASSPVVIGDDVWIGFNSIVLKGVAIGDRSIVAAGSVVVDSIPPDVLAAGNPARVVRSIREGG